MEGALFIIIVFGGGMAVVLSKTEIGRALAGRLRGERPNSPPDSALVEEVDRLRQEVAELHERMDFAERLLSQQREADRLAGGTG
jgi:hypothetical protein